MKKNIKIIYASLAAVVVIALALAIIFTRSSSEPEAEDIVAEAVTPDEEPEDTGELEIILDTLNVPQNALTIPAMQILPLLEEWGEITWVSEDTDIAEVSEDGLILSKAVGETMLIGTSTDGLLTANLPVYVEEPGEEEEETAAPPEGLSMDVTDFRTGQALMDAFFAYYEGTPEVGDEVIDESLEEASDLDDDVVTLADLSASLIWTSTAEDIADVSEVGIVSFLDSGVAAVTAEDEDGNEWLYLEMNLYYGEEIPLEGLDTESTSLEIGIGETISPSIIYTPENTTNKALNWSSDNTNIASVTNTGQITGEAEGTCTVTAISPKDESISLTFSVTVRYIELEGISAGTKSMTVAINSSVNAKVVYAPENATDKDLTWSSSNESIATVDNTGKVTGKKEGNAVITATSKSNTSLTATFDVTVTKDMTINTEGNQVVVYKGSQTVVLYNNGEKVRSMICSTGRSGAETPTGEYTVPAKYGSWYYFRSVGCWIQYGVGIRGNYLFHSVPYYPPSGTSQSDYNAYVSINGYNALGSKASSGCIRMCARDIKWLYNNVSVGTKITITEASGPSADYGLPSPVLANGKSYHWDPTDTNPNNPYGTSISELTISDSSINLDEGSSKTLTASYSPSSSAVSLSWSSSDKKVATVDDNGKVTGVKAGTAKITVKDQFSGKSASCTVTVKSTNVAVTSVKLNTSSKTLTKAGETYQLKATVSPDNATNKNVTWSSSKKSVATVDSNGKVTAVANGTTTITVTTKDGSKKATCEIKVNIDTTVKVTGVSLDKSSASLLTGESLTLKATVAPGNATNKNVTWSSNNKSVATVDSNGKVTAVAAGSAVITVTTSDGKYTASCTITVTAPDPGGDDDNEEDGAE